MGLFVSKSGTSPRLMDHQELFVLHVMDQTVTVQEQR